LREVPQCAEARVQHAYRLLYGRGASDAEVGLALEYLGELQSDSEDAAAEVTSWTSYTHALLGSSELLFVD
jgi:hypothetical protein